LLRFTATTDAMHFRTRKQHTNQDKKRQARQQSIAEHLLETSSYFVQTFVIVFPGNLTET
jgi:hypothetical protein